MTGEEGESPHEGPVGEPVILADRYGHAIPAAEGERLSGQPGEKGGNCTSVIGRDGKPTGARLVEVGTIISQTSMHVTLMLTYQTLLDREAS